MASAPLLATYPTGPLVAPTGYATTAGRAFFLSLFQRTGAEGGVSTAGLQQAIDTEATTRANADAALENGINITVTYINTQITSERTAREAADAVLTAGVASALPLAGGTLSGALHGTTASFTSLQTGGGTGPTWTAGNGAPTATVARGSIFSRLDGGVGTTLYVSQGGGTWNPVAGV